MISDVVHEPDHHASAASSTLGASPVQCGCQNVELRARSSGEYCPRSSRMRMLIEPSTVLRPPMPPRHWKLSHYLEGIALPGSYRITGVALVFLVASARDGESGQHHSLAVSREALSIDDSYTRRADTTTPTIRRPSFRRMPMQAECLGLHLFSLVSEVGPEYVLQVPCSIRPDILPHSIARHFLHSAPICSLWHLRQ